jgi:DNA replication and repair protein RecF
MTVVELQQGSGVEHASCVLRRLVVRDFRNIAHADLDVPGAGFVVIGDNGHGKTSLIEAVYYLHLFRSLRGARDAELVRFGRPAFHVSAAAQGIRHDVIAAGYDRPSGRKKITLDGVECARMSDALGALPSVAFAPADVGVVAGAPGLRRRLVDVALASTSRRYLTALQQYRHALAQRNAALRLTEARSHALVWDGSLAQHGAVLCRERAHWVEWARPRLAALGSALGEGEVLDLRYRAAAGASDPASRAANGEEAGGDAEESVREELSAALAASRDRDVARGLTQVGPHRDDLDLRLGAVSLRRFGSAGQQRTAAIALRLLECAWYRERTGREPLVLLDDPLAELDRRRSSLVLAALGERPRGQSVLAVPRDDDVPEALRGLARYRVRDGVVTGAAE